MQRFFGVVLLLSMALAYAQPTPLVQITLQADGTTPTRDDLNAAQRVLKARLAALGVDDAQIRVRGDDRIVLVVPDDVGSDVLMRRGGLELRLAAPDATPPLTLDDLEAPAFTNTLIASASATLETFGSVVYFEVQKSIQDEFARFTSDHVGRTLAIVVDGRILNAPILYGPLREAGAISGIDTLEDAQTLAALLQTDPLPFDLVIAEITTPTATSDDETF